jgi:hypothetical protein
LESLFVLENIMWYCLFLLFWLQYLFDTGMAVY